MMNGLKHNLETEGKMREHTKGKNSIKDMKTKTEAQKCKICKKNEMKGVS